MKFNFRKIASALASTAMLGSTVALAAAANYPAPFVQNGAADVAIVYGSDLDLTAVTDITTSLSSAMASGSIGNVALTTNAYPLFTGSSPIQLNNSLSSVRTSLTSTNLPSVLSKTEFSGNVEAETSFQIVLGSNRVTFAKQPTTNVDPTVGLAMSTTQSQVLYNASVTFDQAVNFTHEDSEGETLSLFGQNFVVSSATDTNTLVLFKSAQTLSLSVGGSNPVPSSVVEIGSNTYTVELTAGSDTSATIKVTDSSGKSDQKEINEAASKKILGVEVAVNTADESSNDNLGVQAEIIIGADRITLENGAEVKLGTDETPIDGTQVNFITTAYPGNMTKLVFQVYAADGSTDAILPGKSFVDPIFGSFRVAFEGLSSNLDDTENRETILIDNAGSDKATLGFTSWQGKALSNWEFINNETGGQTTAFLGDSEEWRLIVQEMGQINESAFAVIGNEDEGVLVEVSEITNSTDGYNSDSVVLTNVITGDKYHVDITSEGSGTVNIEGQVYTTSYFDNKAGDNSQNVRLNWPSPSTGNNMILYPTIETSKGANLGFYEPLTVDLDDWDGSNIASALMLPDGDGYTSVTVAADSGLGEMWNITFGSTTTGVNTSKAAGASSVAGSIGKFTYNISSSGTVNSTRVHLMDEGSIITNPGIVLFEEENEQNVYEALIIETSGGATSDNGLSISEASFTWNSDADMGGTAYGANGFQTESNSDLYQKLDQWGTLVTTDETDSDQYSVAISYPDEQAVAQIYVDSLSTSGATTLGNVKVMDDQLAGSDMATKNLIVVGGSCVNTAASSLLGSAGCGASWTAATGKSSGEWIIQTWANPWASTKIATLVAGWEQADTANAATYLTTKNPATNVGGKLTGTTATAAVSVTA